MKKTLPLLALFLTLASCASTRHVAYDPTTGKMTHKTVLGGNYGIVPTTSTRGNDGGGGVTGGAFNYKDSSRRGFVESRQPTRVRIGADGSLSIDGTIDHSTARDIQADGVNRAIRNVSTAAGVFRFLK